MEHRAERDAKGFTCWDQFVAMSFYHLRGAQPLREICGGLFPLAKSNCGIWGCPMRQRAPPWPTPTNIALGGCTAGLFYQLAGLL
ncbi:MAG: DUF4372 domain-containing protein [Acidobacteriaceae bacterium]